jgi:hypothetical protein
LTPAGAFPSSCHPCLSDEVGQQTLQKRARGPIDGALDRKRGMPDPNEHKRPEIAMPGCPSMWIARYPCRTRMHTLYTKKVVLIRRTEPHLWRPPHRVKTILFPAVYTQSIQTPTLTVRTPPIPDALGGGSPPRIKNWCETRCPNISFCRAYGAREAESAPGL